MERKGSGDVVTNRKVTGKAMSMPAGIGLGVGISLGMTVAGAAVLALLMDREMMKTEALGYGIMIVLLLGAFVGAMVSAGVIKHRRLMVCLLQGVLYFVGLALINGLLFGGELVGVIPTVILLLGGSGTAALVGLREQGSGRRRRRMIRNG